jgi:hypothetical protein
MVDSMSRGAFGCAAVLAIVACGKVQSHDADAPQQADAPARVCAVGQTTTCSQNTLITCDANGQQVSTETCALGCDSTGTARCKRVDPSNGLATALDNAAMAPDLVLMGQATIDTDAGTITDQSGPRTPPTTSIAGPPVGVFVIEAKTFTANKVTVTGTRALAIVSFGAVQINGALGADASGFGVNGAGAVPGDTTCHGKIAQGPQNNAGQAGGGGGGYGTKGGTGGTGGSPLLTGGAGGQPSGTIELVPLRGGCPGGTASNQSTNYSPGGGGGAIQIVSNTSITVADQGFVSANGGGGVGPVGPLFCIVGNPCGQGEGGGSGGGILLEAPVVTISAQGGVVANGGGATCVVFGSASGGLLSDQAAPGQDCGGGATGNGGNGAAGALPALNGGNGTGNVPVGGGGGGGAGRIRINLPIGSTFTPAGVVSPAPTLGTLGAR